MYIMYYFVVIFMEEGVGIVKFCSYGLTIMLFFDLGRTVINH